MVKVYAKSKRNKNRLLHISSFTPATHFGDVLEGKIAKTIVEKLCTNDRNVLINKTGIHRVIGRGREGGQLNRIVVKGFS